MAQIVRTVGTKRVVRRTINAATAAEAVGPITRGCEIYGLSKGQFSLIELVEHCLAATGPADLVVSTWTAAGADLAHTASFLADGRVRSCRWLVDFSFPSRQPAYCAQLAERFGAHAVRLTANHAKFVTVRNDTWDITVRTSMNLNLNRRLESYEVSECAELAGWLGEIVDDAWTNASRLGDAPTVAQMTVDQIAGRVERRPPLIAATTTAAGLRFGGGQHRGVSHD